MNKSSLPLVEKTSHPQSPWFKNGLHFSCTGCGQCCTGSPGFVWVSEEDILAISGFLKISTVEFTRRFLRKIGNRFSLKEDPRSFDCVFLEGKRCQIYPVRPVQCSTFPWWPTLLASEQSWKDAASCCEGIRCDATLVDSNHIEDQLALYEQKHPKDE